MSEFRFSELRAEGRRLSGVAMPYNTVSPGHREKFLPGAFAGRLADVALDVQHNRSRIIARTGGGGLELRDTPAALLMEATLPETREATDTLTLVRQRVLRGLSVEFVALQESRQGGIRVIERAALPRLSVVDSGSYPGTDIEARRGEQRRSRGRARGRIPKGRNLSCGCHRGACTTVNFDQGAFRRALEDPDREILAVSGEFSRALASRKRGTLTFDDSLADELAFELDIPDTGAGRDVLELSGAVPLLGRPYFDQAASVFQETASVARYSHVALRAIIIGPSDADEGWPELAIRPFSEAEPPRRAGRRRVWL